MKEDEENEDGEEGERMHWGMRKEFKLAMLDKKEKILKIKLEFVGKMKDMLNKMPDGKNK